jgi:hypothetical protein
MNTPIITTITYLNDSNIPDILTNIDVDTYKFKDLDNNSKIAFSFPKYMKHITFNGGKFFHGINNLFNDTEFKDRITLKINIWNKQPSKIEYFVCPDDISISKFTKYDILIKMWNETDNKITSLVNVDVLNSVFFENLLYKNNISLDSQILNMLTDLQEKYNLIMLERENITKPQNNIVKTHIDFNKPKFIQRFLCEKFYNEFMCNFIISQSIPHFNNNNSVFDYNNYKSIDIDNVNNITTIVLMSFQNIIENIKKLYCLKENNSYHIDKIFIVKNDTFTKRKNIDFNNNTSITINILLNTTFKGGTIQFTDELNTLLSKGDMIIYKSDTFQEYCSITNGEQYILVGLINIYEKPI